jgi:hypothetical protein
MADQPSVERFMAADAPSSVARLSIAASAIRSIVNPFAEERDKWNMFSSGDGEVHLATAENIFNDYQKRVARDEQDALLYGTAGWMLKACSSG